MTPEIPVLRLGLAGFSAAQQEAVRSALSHAATGAAHWELVELDTADAWWINGRRTQLVENGCIRVAPAEGGRSLRVHLADVDRPMAFATPLPPAITTPYTFDVDSQKSMGKVLERFEAWLAPLSAQFCLAAHVVEHQSALRPGIYDVSSSAGLLAVVDLRGEVGVLPTAGLAEFDEAVWGLRSGAQAMPEHFARCSLSHLVWQYATRTKRDLLPNHYRTGLLYFRRAPRIAQRLLRDPHLLLMRELVLGPATFLTLRKRTGLAEDQLAHELAALYFVGTITSNPKRAAVPPRPAEYIDSHPGPHSNLPSGLDSVPPPQLPRRRPPKQSDLTAPAFLGPR